MSLSLQDLTEEYYRQIRKTPESVGNRELEHQVGRLLHMRQVVQEIRDRNIPGDFVEFGVYRGFSLGWLAKFRFNCGLQRKIIGVDSFEGLPFSSGPWVRGTFSDSSVLDVHHELFLQIEAAEGENMVIVKSLFNEPGLREQLLRETQQLALIHIDCDLRQSLLETLDLISPLLRGTQYLLLDDWGVVETEIPQGFEEWKLAHPLIQTEEISSTNITKYFRIHSPN